MTTASRPVARKESKAAAQARKGALEEGVRIAIDGEEYVVRVGDITANIARELRATTGRGFNALIAQVTADPDVDLIAEFVWLARRLRGENVALDDVELSYADLLSEGFDVGVPSDEDGDGGPEA